MPQCQASPANCFSWPRNCQGARHIAWIRFLRFQSQMVNLFPASLTLCDVWCMQAAPTSDRSSLYRVAPYHPKVAAAFRDREALQEPFLLLVPAESQSTGQICLDPRFGQSLTESRWIATARLGGAVRLAVRPLDGLQGNSKRDQTKLRKLVGRFQMQMLFEKPWKLTRDGSNSSNSVSRDPSSQSPYSQKD